MYRYMYIVNLRMLLYNVIYYKVCKIYIFILIFGILVIVVMFSIYFLVLLDVIDDKIIDDIYK